MENKLAAYTISDVENEEDIICYEGNKNGKFSIISSYDITGKAKG